ncbi:MAG TPA: DUF4097 family beta strand repeat-containing protein [Candidatus Babeliales bacterium]|nr:DUF4097 family beta strand repeat-containing protein [Candidatus Babeliales bacterium]
MNKNVYIILLVIISAYIITTDCNAELNFKKIKSFFSGTMLEKVEQKELPALSIDAVAINNTNGSITIKTGPQKLLVVKTTMRSKKQTDLDNMEILFDSSKNNHLAIRTQYNGKKITGSVEYELIIPKSLDVSLTLTGNGNAFIKDVHGIIDVVANDTITITNTKKLVSAQTLKKGSIYITNSLGPVEARSHYGDIHGENIADSFYAHSTTGKVNIAYKKLPSTSSINLKTTSGNIMLALPTDTNAEIRGHTTHGVLLSELPITLRSFTTQLNKPAWNKFKQEVDGTLGSGEATIMVHSTKGNVKITETKTT